MTRRVRRPRFRVAAASLLAGLATGCSSAPPEPIAEPRAAAEETAWETLGAPTLLRPPGTSRYRLTIDSDEGRGPQTVVAVFDLDTRADGSEQVALVSFTRARRGEAPAPWVSSPEARREFGGDAGDGDGGALGRFAVPADGTLGGLVPPSVPEPVFGAVTDLLGFLFVQSRGFGADRLRAAGDVRRFEPFTETWSRPPHLLEARVRCPGGALTLAESGADAAVLRWEPDPMGLTILRRAGVRDPGTEGTRILLAGTETMALEVRCDPRTGALLGGRSLRDDLELRLWMGFDGATAPADGALPATGGVAVSFRRELTLERLADVPGPAAPPPVAR